MALEYRAKAKTQGHPYASEEIIAAGYDLAGRVCRELHHAGLPAHVERPGVSRQPGVRVEVNSQGEYAGGLYIRWSAPELAEAGIQAVTERQDPKAPEWKRYTEVALLDGTAGFGQQVAGGLPPSSAATVRRPPTWPRPRAAARS